AFAVFTLPMVGIARHSPQQGGTRRDLDETVGAKPHERNAPRQQAGAYGDESFKAVPPDGEVFQPSAPLSQNSAVHLRSDTCLHYLCTTKQKRPALCRPLRP